jgi:hypothetical protein
MRDVIQAASGPEFDDIFDSASIAGQHRDVECAVYVADETKLRWQH